MNKKLALWAVVLMMGVASCKKDQYPATAAPPTLQQYISQDTTLSLFQLALSRTGLDTVLAKGGPNTAFAPDNSAFLAVGLTADVLNRYDIKALYNIIGYEIIPGRVSSSTVIGFTSDSMRSLNKDYQPIVSLNYYGLFIDGVLPVQGNIALADGILHKLGQVAFPPAASMLAVLDSLPDTRMAAYIYHHSAVLSAYASDPGSFVTGTKGFTYGVQASPSGTLLVPSDAAFAAYGFNTTDDLAALDTLTRTNLVAHCILIGSYFTSDFMGGCIVRSGGTGYPLATDKPLIPLASFSISPNPTNQQLNLIIGFSNFEFGTDGLSLYGNGIQTPPMIIQPNIIATGGVVHVINQLFAPQGIYSPGHTHG